jgi:broad specificity phosphatase PhoE
MAFDPYDQQFDHSDRPDVVLLLRHADAGVKGGWDGPDELRPLSAAGQRQADGLVVRLEDYPVERILCSPTLRCYQTVTPLADDRFLGVEPAAALGVDASLAQVLGLLRDGQLRNAALCMHGEMIGALLTHLVAEGLSVEEPLHWPNGSTWLLQRVDRRPVRGRFLAPLALNGARTGPG